MATAFAIFLGVSTLISSSIHWGIHTVATNVTSTWGDGSSDNSSNSNVSYCTSP